MNILLIIAHGSRKKESNEEVAQLVENLKKQIPPHIDRIQHSFLELADPRASDAIPQLVKDGATHITICPYFLSAGKHVAIDLPCLLDQQKEAFPQITFKVTPHIGALPGIETLILEA